MNPPLIWIHDEALRATHPVFTAGPVGTKAIFVWDDSYLQQLGYSLKRLVFIYETLTKLPVEIIKGNTLYTIKELSPPCVYVPESNKPHINSIMAQIQSSIRVKIIPDEPFIITNEFGEFNRFFKYWKAAEKSALQKNGAANA